MEDEKQEKLITNSDKDENLIVLDFYKIIFLYLLGGLTGTVWETVLNIVKNGEFIYCSGSIFTPFNFVYGIGAIAIACSLRGFKKPWQVFVIGCGVGGLTEYTLSFLEEKILGTRSWDYSNEFLNINGRTTVPFCLFWGVLCVVIIFLVYKPVMRFTERFPEKLFRRVMVILLVIVAIDMVFSLGAILRYSQRASGMVADNPLAQFFDTYFNDEFMKLHFPGMNFGGA